MGELDEIGVEPAYGHQGGHHATARHPLAVGVGPPAHRFLPGRCDAVGQVDGVDAGGELLDLFPEPQAKVGDEVAQRRVVDVDRPLGDIRDQQVPHRSAGQVVAVHQLRHRLAARAQRLGQAALHDPGVRDAQPQVAEPDGLVAPGQHRGPARQQVLGGQLCHRPAGRHHEASQQPRGRGPGLGGAGDPVQDVGVRVLSPGQQMTPGVIEPGAQQERETRADHIESHQGTQSAGELPQPPGGRRKAGRVTHGLPEPERPRLLEPTGLPPLLPRLARHPAEVVEQKVGTTASAPRRVHALADMAQLTHQREDRRHRCVLVALRRDRPSPVARRTADGAIYRDDPGTACLRVGDGGSDAQWSVPNSAARSAGS